MLLLRGRLETGCIRKTGDTPALLLVQLVTTPAKLPELTPKFGVAGVDDIVSRLRTQQMGVLGKGDHGNANLISIQPAI